jgi:hypothetical protein
MEITYWRLSRVWGVWKTTINFCVMIVMKLNKMC